MLYLAEAEILVQEVFAEQVVVAWTGRTGLLRTFRFLVGRCSLQMNEKIRLHEHHQDGPSIDKGEILLEKYSDHVQLHYHPSYRP